MAGQAQTVLVVEDESSIASFVALYLKNAGYGVRTVGTGGDALERVWGYTFAGDTRTVDVHVRQLRRKLGEASPIVTVWGVGYKVAPARDAAVSA